IKNSYMSFKIKTITFRFPMPVAFSKGFPVKKWFWNKGKNKMLSPEERKRYQETLDTDEYKNIILEEQETKSQKATTLIEFLTKKGYLKR
ncbi:unnamed protein product, partial [marine sediment metagenome]